MGVVVQSLFSRCSGLWEGCEVVAPMANHFFDTSSSVAGSLPGSGRPIWCPSSFLWLHSLFRHLVKDRSRDDGESHSTVASAVGCNCKERTGRSPVVLQSRFSFFFLLGTLQMDHNGSFSSSQTVSLVPKLVLRSFLIYFLAPSRMPKLLLPLFRWRGPTASPLWRLWTHENTWKHIKTEPSLVILLELTHFLVLVLWSSHQDFFTDGTMPSTSHQLLSRFSHINQINMF